MLKNLYLHYVKLHETGMYGVLMDNDGLPFAVSLQPDILFFPDGEYECIPTTYYRGGYKTFEIIIPGHTRVLFHIGNHEEDSKLCVLIGESFEIVEGKPGIAQSGKGFKEFMDKYGPEQKFKLKVSSAKDLR